MSDILESSVNGIKKTPLVYKTNLNFRQAEKYTSILIDYNLLKKEDNLFITTEKGLGFLKYYHHLLNQFKPENRREMKPEILHDSSRTHKRTSTTE